MSIKVIDKTIESFFSRSQSSPQNWNLIRQTRLDNNDLLRILFKNTNYHAADLKHKNCPQCGETSSNEFSRYTFSLLDFHNSNNTLELFYKNRNPDVFCNNLNMYHYLLLKKCSEKYMDDGYCESCNREYTFVNQEFLFERMNHEYSNY